MTSWIFSAKSTLSMLSYISSLEIHDLTQTINLNKARTVLYELARVYLLKIKYKSTILISLT